jgi:hypothetical protein
VLLLCHFIGFSYYRGINGADKKYKPTGAEQTNINETKNFILRYNKMLFYSKGVFDDAPLSRQKKEEENEKQNNDNRRQG